MALRDKFPILQHNQRSLFDQKLDELENLEYSFSYFTDVKQGTYSHTTFSFEFLTGYPVSLFEKEGVNFYLTRVPSDYPLKVAEVQAEFFKRSLIPGYDQSKPDIGEFPPTKLQLADGTAREFMAFCIPLKFAANGEHELVLITALLGDKKSRLEIKLKSLLFEIKLLYQEVFNLQMFNDEKTLNTIELILQTQPRHVLSAKEKEVLKQIAKGNSTKEIASVMGVSENTVETHRKNMLMKLDAKNVAELIKKASKLYWLE